MTEVYRGWINAPKDRAGRARIQVRVDRLAHCNPGQHRHLADGISELKVDFGAGYRVYDTERNGRTHHPSRGWRHVKPTARHQGGHHACQEPLGEPEMPKASTKTPATTQTVPCDVAEQLRTPEEMAAYLDAWLAEAPDDAPGIARALGISPVREACPKCTRRRPQSRRPLQGAERERQSELRYRAQGCPGAGCALARRSGLRHGLTAPKRSRQPGLPEPPPPAPPRQRYRNRPPAPPAPPRRSRPPPPSAARDARCRAPASRPGGRR